MHTFIVSGIIFFGLGLAFMKRRRPYSQICARGGGNDLVANMLSLLAMLIATFIAVFIMISTPNATARSLVVITAALGYYVTLTAFDQCTDSYIQWALRQYPLGEGRPPLRSTRCVAAHITLLVSTNFFMSLVIATITSVIAMLLIQSGC